MAVAAAVRKRVHGDVVRLVHRDLALAELSTAVSGVLGRAVPFDGTCLLTIDPATLLPTGEVVENGLPVEASARLAEIELAEPDFNKLVDLARAPLPAASLSDATAGDLDRSLRHRELRSPNGVEDELRTVLTDSTGTWGALTLLREARRPHFTPTEVRFVASLAGALAEALRRTTLRGETAADGDNVDDGETGLLVLAPDSTLEMANRAADRWLDELGTGDAGNRSDRGLPLVVHTVAGQTRRAASGRAGGVASARVKTSAGRWVVVRGSLVGDGLDARVAVLLEAARPPDLAPLIADAYGLTERERLVTELVARGFSTNEIARRLHLSAYTVQDHLKSIFDKSGTGSRGELVARLFFDHYAPRLTSAAGTTNGG